MDSGANSVAESVGESPAPEPEVRPASKGRGLRRWRRIPREPHREVSPASPGAVGGAGAGAGEDLAQLHKRRLAPPADAPKGKQDAAGEEESPVASVESNFVPPEASPPPPPPVTLDPNLGLLIATAGFSVGAGGADSDNSDDRASKSSTAASAPRHDFSFTGFGRERDRVRSRTAGAAVHGKSLRSARVRGASARATAAAPPVEAENSLSSVESKIRSSNAAHSRRSSAGITSNGVHKVLFPNDHHSDEEPPDEEVRYGTGGFYKENGSGVRRSVLGNRDSDTNNHSFDEASVGKFDNGGIHSGLDPYAESIALLQAAQEALENEIQKFVDIKEETDENSTIHLSEEEWSNSPRPDESAEEQSERLKFPESKLEEASFLMNQKDSRTLEVDALSSTHPQETVACDSSVFSRQSDIEQLLLERMEAEIQCFILTRALQTWKPLTTDEITLYEVQTSEADHKPLEAKLRHAQCRAVMLEEMVDKLEVQCNELSETSEVLKLQARASRASLFCSIQLLLLCIAVGTLLVRFLPSSPDLVPT